MLLNPAHIICPLAKSRFAAQLRVKYLRDLGEAHLSIDQPTAAAAAEFDNADSRYH